MLDFLYFNCLVWSRNFNAADNLRIKDEAEDSARAKAKIFTNTSQQGSLSLNIVEKLLILMKRAHGSNANVNYK